MALYELTGQYLQLQQMLDVDQTDMSPEEAAAYQQAVKDTMEALTGEIEEQADNLACIVKDLKAQADALKNEADRLSKRAQVKASKAKSLTEYLYSQMALTGNRKIETPRNVLTVKKTPAAVKVHDETAFWAWANLGNDDFIRLAAPEMDKKAVREALKAGQEIPGVTLESGETLSIQ